MDNQSKLNTMNEIALKSRQNAYCPYSDFPVGSCALGVDGKFYSGCNIENAIETVCAERLSILKMVENGCREIKQLYVVTEKSGEKITPPCGFCRQYIKEFSKNDNEVLIHIGSISKGYEKTFLLSELFPFPFSPPLKAQKHK